MCSVLQKPSEALFLKSKKHLESVWVCKLQKPPDTTTGFNKWNNMCSLWVSFWLGLLGPYICGATCQQQPAILCSYNQSKRLFSCLLVIRVLGLQKCTICLSSLCNVSSKVVKISPTPVFFCIVHYVVGNWSQLFPMKLSYAVKSINSGNV